ncbi:MAG: hypothetical protein GY757_55670, partial [bacterium]|nr:hypothetical protein [bacterium]
MKKMKHPLLILTVVIFTVILFLTGTGEANNPQRIKNLETFAKLYGYVRYFHPSDEATKIDWERLAVYGAKQIETVQNEKELKEILEKLFKPIAPGMELYHSNEKREPSNALIQPPDTTNMKPVTWQHLGVGLNRTQSFYLSIRLNKKNILPPKGSGNLMTKMDAGNLKGKEFRFKAAVKAGAGSANLWLRVDRENGNMGFFDNMRNQPIKTNQWKVYEIKGKIDDDAKSISFGCLLSGSGKIYMDDFQFQVKENDRWEPIQLKNPGFEKDTEGNAPGNWMLSARSYDGTVTTQNPATGKQCFLIKDKIDTIAEPLFEQKAAFGENIHKKIGNNITCIIPLVLYGTDTYTYPQAPPKDLENLQTAIKNGLPEELTARELCVRRGDVIITWNVLQHFYPYFEEVTVDWRRVLTRALQNTQEDKSEEDFYNTLVQMIEKLQDGHGRVYHPLLSEKAGLPIKMDWIENRVVVTYSGDDKILLGDIIQAVDGKDAKTALETLEKRVSGSSQRKRFIALRNLCKGKKGTTAHLKIQRDGQEMEISLKRNFNGYLNEFDRKSIEEIEPGIFYINLENIKDFEAEVEKLTRAKAIIFDGRGYIGYRKKDILS